MKKRQRKKNKKKYIPVIMDEIYLFNMTEEERKTAYDEYEKFVNRNAFRKKYKNLKAGSFLVYQLPLGERDRAIMEQMAKKIGR